MNVEGFKALGAVTLIVCLLVSLIKAIVREELKKRSE